MFDFIINESDLEEIIMRRLYGSHIEEGSERALHLYRGRW